MTPNKSKTPKGDERLRSLLAEDEAFVRTTVHEARANPSVWTDTMLRHRYSEDEAAGIAGFSAAERADYLQRLGETAAPAPGQVEVWPYPGGRHPRIGFLEGAIDPLRGSKASVFLPWEPESYVVADLPELITSHLGHLFLAHTHVRTIWNEQNVWLDNVDWQRAAGGGLTWSGRCRTAWLSAHRYDLTGTELISASGCATALMRS